MNYFEMSVDELEMIKENLELDISNLLNAKQRLENALYDVDEIEGCDDLIGYFEQDLKEIDNILNQKSDEIKEIIEQLQDRPVSEYEERMHEYRQMQGF